MTTEHLKLKPDATAISLELLHSLQLDASQTALVERVARMIAERDRSLEDYLNEHLVRRMNTTFTVPTADWTNVGNLHSDYGHLLLDGLTPATPAAVVQVTKASQHSLLRCDAFISGDAGHSTPGTTSWLSLGVEVDLPDLSSSVADLSDEQGRVLGSFDGWIELARRPFTDPDPGFVLAGSNAIAGLDEGRWAVVLVLSSEDGSGLFTVKEDASITLSVTETPG